jgi:hypothetical protein
MIENILKAGLAAFKIFSIITLYVFLTKLSMASYSFTPVSSKTAASAYTRLLLTTGTVPVYSKTTTHTTPIRL